MITKQTSQALSIGGLTSTSDDAAAATAVVITLAAAANFRNVLHGVQWSYSAAPTGGRLTIENGAGGPVLFDVDIIAGGPGGFSFCIAGSANTAMVITLASGAGAVIGKLNTQSIRE